MVEKMFTRYELRTKSGDGEFDYFIESQSLVLSGIIEYIQEHDLDPTNYNIVQISTIEYTFPSSIFPHSIVKKISR